MNVAHNEALQMLLQSMSSEDYRQGEPLFTKTLHFCLKELSHLLFEFEVTTNSRTSDGDAYLELRRKVIQEWSNRGWHAHPFLQGHVGMAFKWLYLRESSHSQVSRLVRYDAARQLLCFSLSYSGDSPGIQIYSEKQGSIPATYGKKVNHKVFGHTAFSEQLTWLCLDSVDGLQVRDLTANKTLPFVMGKSVYPMLSRDLVDNMLSLGVNPDPHNIHGVPANSQTESKARKGRPWLLMDRPERADDNAEHLYRRGLILNKSMAFMLSKDSTDWPRLEREGFNLVPFENHAYSTLLGSYRGVISSHIPTQFTTRMTRWNNIDIARSELPFIYLSHGIHQHKNPRHFSRAQIDVICTATNWEADLLSHPDSGYLCHKEILCTGLPRHQALKTIETRPEYVTIMPTWRIGFINRRLNKSTSSFIQHWQIPFNNDVLTKLYEQFNLKPRFITHPMMKSVKDINDAFGKYSVDMDSTRWHDIIAKTAVLITDYSSVAFDFALSGVPVIYFQPDFNEHEVSGHAPELAFDYKSNGFGPVCHTGSALEQEATQLLLRKEVARRQANAAKVDRFFSYDNGDIGERTWASIEALGY